MLADALQTTFEDAVPLTEVEFVVVDLETTGGSPADSRITEIGAVKLRGGERTGVFETLVNPGVPIPRQITHLTGIDDLVVAGAPPIEWVLPSFAEFARGCVFVAHNARFDFSFLNVALERLDYDALPPPPVCTARLARRVVWPDVPNVRLHTLAQYFRTAVRPSHRALPDAEACSEVLHGLLELGGRLGIVTLGDLHGAVRARGRPNFGKIRLADHLPSAPGVYLFRARDGRVLYVGKSVDLRSRVKSYFYGDGRKKVEDLLAETASVDGVACGSELESLDPRGAADPRARAEVQPPGQDLAEVRLPSDRRRRGVPADQGRARDRRAAAPSSARSPRRSLARLAKEALEDVFPIRRCTTAMRASTRFAPCALAEMHRCLAPCDGRAGPERYEELVRSLISSLSTPGGLLGTLEARMRDLAEQERFEEAALARDRLRALAEALARSRIDGWLLRTDDLVLRDAAGHRFRLRRGGLIRNAGDGPLGAPCPRERADELSALRAWVARNEVRVESSAEPFAEPVAGGAELHRLLGTLRARDRTGGARSDDG